MPENEKNIKVENGRAKYTLPSTLPEGIYKITARYTDDEDETGSYHYLPSSTVNTVTISKNVVRGIVNDGNTYETMWYESIVPKVQFLQKGNPIVGGNVTCRLEGQNDKGQDRIIGTGVTDETGTVTFNEYTLKPSEVTKTLINDYYTTDIYFELEKSPENIYNGQSVSETIHINKRPLSITLNFDSPIKRNASATFNGTLTDSNNPTNIDVQQLPITLWLYQTELNDETIITPSSDFSYSYVDADFGSIDSGTYEIKAICEGNEVFKKAEIVKNITVLQDTTITPTANYTVRDNVPSKISAHFYKVSNNGNIPLTGFTGITCKITTSDGNILYKEDNLTTDSNGIATCTYTPSPSSPRDQRALWSIDATGNTMGASSTLEQCQIIHTKDLQIKVSTGNNNPGSLIYSKQTVYNIIVTDLVGNPVGDIDCYLSITKGTSSYNLNTKAVTTDTMGKAILQYTCGDYPIGDYQLQCTTSGKSTYYNSAQSKEYMVRVMAVPKIYPTQHVYINESYDKSIAKMEDQYPNKTETAVLEAVVRKNTQNGPVFPNITFSSINLEYTDDNGTNKELKLAGPIKTDANGKVSIKYPVPCAKLAFINTVQYNIDNIPNEYHSAQRNESQKLYVRRYISMNVPAHDIQLGSKKDIRVENVTDSHGLDITDCYVEFAGSPGSKGQGIIIKASNETAAPRTSTDNILMIHDWEVPYQTKSLTCKAYYINAYCTNTTKYVLYTQNNKNESTGKAVLDYYSNDPNTVNLVCIPQITAYIAPNPKPKNDTVPVWYNIKDTNAIVNEDQSIALKLTCTYPYFDSSKNTMTQRGAPNVVIHATLNNENFLKDSKGNIVESVKSGGSSSNEGPGVVTLPSQCITSEGKIQSTWTVPDKYITYINKLRLWIDSTDNFLKSAITSYDLRIKNCLVFTLGVRNPSMSLNGKFRIYGYIKDYGGNAMSNVQFYLRVSTQLSTLGTQYVCDTNGNKILFTSNSEGMIDKTWDNSTKSKGHVDLRIKNSSTGEYAIPDECYLNMELTGANASQYVRSGPVGVTIQDESKLVIDTNEKYTGSVPITAHVYQADGTPIDGIRNVTVTCKSLNFNKTGLSSNSTGLISTNVDIPNPGTYTFIVSFPDQTVNGTTYTAKSSQTKINVKQGGVYFVLGSQQITSNNSSNATVNVTVYRDEAHTIPYTNKPGFYVYNTYTKLVEGEMYTTDNNGRFTATLHTQGQKGIKCVYQIVQASVTKGENVQKMQKGDTICLCSDSNTWNNDKACTATYKNGAWVRSSNCTSTKNTSEEEGILGRIGKVLSAGGMTVKYGTITPNSAGTIRDSGCDYGLFLVNGIDVAMFADTHSWAKNMNTFWIYGMDSEYGATSCDDPDNFVINGLAHDVAQWLYDKNGKCKNPYAERTVNNNQGKTLKQFYETWEGNTTSAYCHGDNAEQLAQNILYHSWEALTDSVKIIKTSANIVTTINHKLVATSNNISIKASDTSYHSLGIYVHDSSWNQGDDDGVKGTYTYPNNNGTWTYTLKGIGYHIYVRKNGTTGNGESIKDSTLHILDTSNPKGLLSNSGTTSKKQLGYWSNYNNNSTNSRLGKGTYDLILRPVVNDWTANQKTWYIAEDIVIPKKIVIK